MRLFTFALFSAFLLQSCAKKEAPEIHADPKGIESKKGDIIGQVSATSSEGKLLLEGADCSSCHTLEAKVIGPSYLDIAGKYENNEANRTLLAGKIINGGSGVWGNVPMSAHPGMTQETAKKMVEYILSLKK